MFHSRGLEALGAIQILCKTISHSLMVMQVLLTILSLLLLVAADGRRDAAK